MAAAAELDVRLLVYEGYGAFMTTANDLLAALPVAVYTTDTEGRLTFYNEAAAALWGRHPEVGELWCGSLRILHLDGSPLPHDQCPMAISLKEGRTVRGLEAVVERPDGSQVVVRPHPTPLRDENGVITGGVNLVMDLSEQNSRAEQASHLAAIVSSSDDAIISKTLGGVITSWNAAAERIFGYRADEMIGQPILRLIPHDLHDEEKHIISQLARGERVDHYETVRLGKDGRKIDVSLTVSPIRDRTGKVVGASKVARDVTERKRAEEVQDLLLNELNHRIKNTLATVQAIASQTLRRAPSAEDFVASFNGRIHALARAHMLLTGGAFQGAEISQLVRDQLLLGGPSDPRITCSGPTMLLEADAALHLALVLHELGTNARKYGALSSPNGAILIDWEMLASGSRTLLLTWQEKGGPTVVAPSSRGFGSVLIERSLQAHGGTAIMRFAEGGVSCSITLPLPDQIEPLVRRQPKAAQSMLAQYAPQTGHPGSVGRRILVIEDEALISMDLVDHLTEAGFEVVGPAQSVSEARRLIASADFDGALLDGNLAGHRVDDLAVALTRKGAPFVFVTGYGREALPPAFRDRAMIEKPFSREQVLAALERLWRPDQNIVPLPVKAGA